MFAYDTLGRPPHEFGVAVTTPEMYRGFLVATLREAAARYPLKKWPTAHIGDSRMVGRPLVNHGIWKVRCYCTAPERPFPFGEYPIYSPEWKLACCFACGAIYDGIEPPDRWEEIEAILLKRSVMEQRNWTTESVEELAAEVE